MRYEPSDDMKLFGRYVRRSRGMVGIGQRTLAARSFVSQSTVARLELGRGGGMATYHLVDIGHTLGRWFPLGCCPHEHRCDWQPIEPPPPPSERDLIRELMVERGLDRPLPLWARD